MQIAITRQISRTFENCQLTHLERLPIDLQLARRQHAAYEQVLSESGCVVQQLPEQPDLPDAVFVEDIAVVLDEVAVIARPGAFSRRAEVYSVQSALSAHRPLLSIEAPGTLDGGDVLAVKRTLYVGFSSRTNERGIVQLRQLMKPFGYQVLAIPLTGCLHLKSAVTQVGPEMLLLNPLWVDPTLFAGFQLVEVDPAEPMAANALLVNDTLIYPAAFLATRRRLESAGCLLREVDVSEISKAEGGVTCCSLIFKP